MPTDSASTLAPAYPKQIANTSDAVKIVGRQIRHGRTLMPWMLAYAEWLCIECLERPTTPQRTVRARGLARAPVTALQLRMLEKRKDFADYCDELAKGPIEAARAKFQSAFPTYIEAHREALDIARESKDVNAIARLTEPVLDRVMPKKGEGQATNVVTIVLSAGQQAGVRSYVAPPVLVQEVEPEPVTDDRPNDSDE